MATVKNIGRHPVELTGGVELAPGDSLGGVDPSQANEAANIAAGNLIVVSGSPPPLAQAASPSTLPDFRPFTIYPAGYPILHAGVFYQATVAFTSGATFSEANWSAAGGALPPSVQGVSDAWASGNSDVLAALGRSDLARSAGLHQVDYEDAAQIVETWANLTAWVSEVSTAAVSGGTLYNPDGGFDFLARDFAPSDSGRGYLTTTLVLPAGPDTAAGDGSAIAGIVLITDTAETFTPAVPPSALYAAYIYVDLYSGAVVFVSDTDQTLALVNGSPPVTLSGSDPTYPGYPGVNLTSAQTLGMTIAWDENSMVAVLMDEGHNWEISFTIPRVTGVKSVGLVLGNETRGLSGAAIGPVFAKQSYASPVLSATDPRPMADRIYYSGSTASYGGGSESEVRLWVPKETAGRDSRVPAPLLIWCHGANTDGTPGERLASEAWANPTYPVSTWTAIQELSSAGVVICNPALENNNMGTTPGTADLLAAYRYARDRLSIGPVILAGASMGAMTAINALAARTIPNVTGLLLFSPLCDFMRLYSIFYDEFVTEGLPDDLYFTGFGPQPATFWEPFYTVPFGYSTFAAAGANIPGAQAFDPMQHSTGSLRGVGMLLLAGANDPLIPGNSTDCANFVAKFGTFAREATAVTVAGAEHVDPLLFQGAQIATIASFVARCAAA